VGWRGVAPVEGDFALDFVSAMLVAPGEWCETIN
jgi:hypothetical protein